MFKVNIQNANMTYKTLLYYTDILPIESYNIILIVIEDFYLNLSITRI